MINTTVRIYTIRVWRGGIDDWHITSYYTCNLNICTTTQRDDRPIDNTNYRPGDTACGGLRTQRA